MFTFLFDLDGVIYRDNEPMPGAAETVAALRAAGHHILFATNNGTRSRQEFVAKLIEVGVPATIDDLATSGYATARYLASRADKPADAMVIGSAALRADLQDAGIRALDTPLSPADRDSLGSRGRPDCVVVSLDRAFTYEKMVQAQEAVLRGALLVATNRDPQFPGADRLYPGAGSIVAAVETACQQQAIAIGKPGPLLYETLLRATGSDLAHTIVIGDNLITDIAAAQAMHLPSILVLTGISRREDLATSAAHPTRVIETLPELLTMDLESIVSGRA